MVMFRYLEILLPNYKLVGKILRIQVRTQSVPPPQYYIPQLCFPPLLEAEAVTNPLLRWKTRKL